MNIKLNNVNILEKQESLGRKNKKAEEKHSYTTQPKTSTSHKVRNSLVGAGLALASLVGMSSCSETNQIVDINLDKLFEYIDSINDRLDKIIEKMDNNYVGLLEKLQDILEQQKLNEANQDKFRKQLISLLEQYHLENSQYNQAILDILNNNSLTAEQRYQKIMEMMQQIVDQLGKLDGIQESIDNLEQTITVNGEKVSNLIKEAILEFKEGKIELKELNQKIAELIANSDLQNKEVIEKMNEILKAIENGQITDQAALDKIAALLQTISDDVKDIAAQLKALAQLVESGDKQLSQDIQNLTNKYEQGNADLNSTLVAILEKAEQQCTNGSTIISQIEQLKELIANGQMGSTEALESIKDILNTINTNIETANKKIDDVIAALGKLDSNLSAKLDALINKYDQGQISMEELVQQILAESVKSNQISQETLTEIQNLKAQLAAGQISMAEALDKLTQLVQDIKDISQEILNSLKEFAAQFQEYKTENDANLKNLGNQMSQVVSGVGDINEQLKNLNKTADAIYGSVTKLGTTVDNIYAELGDIKNEMGSGLTAEQLEDILAKKEPELYKQFQNIVDVVAQGNTKLDNIIDIMNAFKSFGDKLDGMGDKVNELVALMQTSNETQLSNAQAIINEIKALAAGGTANTAEINAKLDEAIGLLGDIKQLLEEISGKMNTVISNQEKAQEKADAYMTNSMNTLQQILDKMVSGEDFASLVTKFESYVENAQAQYQVIQQDNAQFKALLEELIAKQGNGGMTKEEMIEAIQEGLKGLNIPNYSEVLDEISSKLDDIIGSTGSDITLEALEQLFQKYQSNADLSLTNELLDQILSVTGAILNQSGMGGSGSVDTSEIKSLISQVLEAIKTGNTDSIDSIKALQKTLAEIKAQLDNIANQGGGETAFARTAMKNLERAIARMDNYNAYANLVRSEYKANDGQTVRTASAGNYRPDTFYWRA